MTSCVGKHMPAIGSSQATHRQLTAHGEQAIWVIFFHLLLRRRRTKNKRAPPRKNSTGEKTGTGGALQGRELSIFSPDKKLLGPNGFSRRTRLSHEILPVINSVGN
jgi:hypothetical protein